jgi:hypothetical protein
MWERLASSRVRATSGIEDPGEPTVDTAEVDADDRRPFANQLPDGPRADTPQRARDEEALRGHALTTTEDSFARR